MKSFFSKKIVVGALVAATVCVSGITDAKAQEFAVQGDIVSSYVWRGMYQGGGAAFQPTLGFGFDNFSVTAWGSTNFSGGNKELDLTLAYKFGKAGPTLTVADLWWAGQGAHKYFNFKSHETAHHFEAGVAYTVQSETFPLSVAWYTMFAGQDKNAEGDQNYSSYVEFNYPFRVRMVDLNVTCGMVPYAAPQYNCDGFAVTNVALKGTTQIRFTDKFALPVFAQAVWNPRMEDAHLVFGITLKP